jgi:23S rRNA pseudoU1915 N3-methylase RlmH
MSTRSCRRRGRRLLGREGTRNGRWALLDFGDVVMHVFYHPVREVFDIESLWIDAPRVKLQVPPEAMIIAGRRSRRSVKILVRAVGKMRDRRLESVCQEYVDRARRHLPVAVEEVDSDADLLRNLPAGAEVVALEPGGDCWTTAEFIKYLDQRMVHGTRAIAFLIGGAEGLAPATVAAAQEAPVPCRL